MLSVIIPSRSDEYLKETVADLLKKADGEIEVIIILDGYWPKNVPEDDPRIRMIHHGMQHDNYGMRSSIEKGIALARGKYIMKIDEHCMLDQGYDVKLAADCEDNWVVIPRRYRLDPDKWEVINDGRPPIDYNYIAYPYTPSHRNPLTNGSSAGLAGAEWRRHGREEIMIDDTMSCQGSCYFTTKEWWEKMIGPMDVENYGPFTQEAQEVCQKTWLGGGRVVVNKKTWYAHMHKGSRGKNYGFSNAQYKTFQYWTDRGRYFSTDFWLNDKWDKLAPGRNWKWFMDHFGQVPGWPANWEEQVKIDRAKEDEERIKSGKFIITN